MLILKIYSKKSILNPKMMRGWSKRLVIYVYLQKRYRRGVLIRKMGLKWTFKPDRYQRTVLVCPIRDKWHYNSKQKLKTWSTKMSVLMAGNKPFQYQRERIGGWSGAKTCRTHAVQLRVWQVVGTSDIYVGHLGQYTLAIVSNGKLTTLVHEPGQQQFFIGRGVLDKRKFKCLKIVQQPYKRAKIQKTIALYAIPTREELG